MSLCYIVCTSLWWNFCIHNAPRVHILIRKSPQVKGTKAIAAICLIKLHDDCAASSLNLPTGTSISRADCEESRVTAKLFSSIPRKSSKDKGHVSILSVTSSLWGSPLQSLDIGFSYPPTNPLNPTKAPIAQLDFFPLSHLSKLLSQQLVHETTNCTQDLLSQSSAWLKKQKTLLKLSSLLMPTLLHVLYHIYLKISPKIY